MAETTVPDYPRGLTFEKVWAMFQETDRKFQETREQMKETDLRLQETDRIIKENQKETGRLMKETDRRMKETDRRIGELGNRFGELAEHLVAPSIKEKFKELDLNFEQLYHDLKIIDAKGRSIAEIDIVLENRNTVMAVEVKAKPLQKDVDEHVRRIEILRRRADARQDKRKFRGAIAGAIMIDDVRDYAHKTGLYVIEQTGDTVMINIPKGFKAKEW
jgi:hypothetical protein